MVQSKTDPSIPRSIKPLACHIIFIIIILIDSMNHDHLMMIFVVLVRATSSSLPCGQIQWCGDAASGCILVGANPPQSCRTSPLPGWSLSWGRGSKYVNKMIMLQRWRCRCRWRWRWRNHLGGQVCSLRKENNLLSTLSARPDSTLFHHHCHLKHLRRNLDGYHGHHQNHPEWAPAEVVEHFVEPWWVRCPIASQVDEPSQKNDWIDYVWQELIKIEEQTWPKKW